MDTERLAYNLPKEVLKRFLGVYSQPKLGDRFLKQDRVKRKYQKRRLDYTLPKEVLKRFLNFNST